MQILPERTGNQIISRFCHKKVSFCSCGRTLYSQGAFTAEKMGYPSARERIILPLLWRVRALPCDGQRGRLNEFLALSVGLEAGHLRGFQQFPAALHASAERPNLEM
jgi:hypothetical protein